MRFVVTLLVPAQKIGAVKRVMPNVDPRWIDIFAHQIRDESRNPLAFVHGGLNLSAAPMMGKRARFTFPEGSPESIQGGRSEE